MSQEIILRIGNTIEYGNGRKGQVERIRIISSGEFVEEYKYEGKGNNIVLTIKANNSITNLWVKDTPIHKITEKQEKG